MITGIAVVSDEFSVKHIVYQLVLLIVYIVSADVLIVFICISAGYKCYVMMIMSLFRVQFYSLFHYITVSSSQYVRARRC